MSNLYRCLDCLEVFSLVATPEEADAAGRWEADANLEWLSHRDHRLESLRPARRGSYSRDPYDAPRRTVYAMATNGHEQFLLVRHKPSPSQPCRYELRRATILELPPRLRLREEELLKQIVWEKSGARPSPEDIAAFVSMLRRGLERLEPEDLSDEAADLRHPLVSYSRAPDSLLRWAVENCRRKLCAEASEWLAAFVERHRYSYVPLGLEITRDFRIVEEQPVEGSVGTADREGQPSPKLDRAV